MAMAMAVPFFAWFILFLLPCLCISSKQTYIVHMKHQKPLSYATHHEWYTAQLQSLSSSSSSLLYTYTTAYHGFAASLDSDQAESLRRSDSVLGIYKDTIYTLHTTRSPEFLGLNNELGLWAGHRTQDLNHASQDVIVGVLDTGVWPESKSFDDSGMEPIPTRWLGECETGDDFKSSSCNKKLIGARFFSKGYRINFNHLKKSKEIESPRDSEGHGTHTASTAVGSRVANASLFGYANGTARGMATNARLAVYKVCWNSGPCFGSDILAGMDRAITDGVDVLSISIGSGTTPYYLDPIALGAFTAMGKGIFVSCSAGNNGPHRASVSNVAPWIATVGAGTLDRDFPAYASLGNRKKFTGVSLYSGKGMGSKPVELVYGKGKNRTCYFCLPDSLEPGLVRGKVVLCDRGLNARVEKGEVVRDAGGLGMILANTQAEGEELVADSHLLPAVAVGRKTGDLIRAYARSDLNPTAVLSFGETVLNIRPSPVVAAFSSRGPNVLTPQILKPDLIGPGVNILAAWPGAIGPTGLPNDTRRTPFNIISGTSMSCPHISGVAALLKAAHPDWSPSAIKSALMTTAYIHDNSKSPLRDAASGSFSNPWVHGSGHVDPQKALSPGLIYDITVDDYIAFLCSLNYSIVQVQAIALRPNVTCSRRLSDPGSLNYPSFSVVFGSTRVVRYTRELKNVGPVGSVYNVTYGGPPTVKVIVKPTKLVFRKLGQKKRYTVTFIAKKGTKRMKRGVFGWLLWSNAKHEVRSPVSYSWK